MHAVGQTGVPPVQNGGEEIEKQRYLFRRNTGSAKRLGVIVGSNPLNSGYGEDLIYGNKGADTLSGGGNEDLLYGGQGNAILYGNAGNDSLSGNLGADTLCGGQGNDTLAGGGGADRIEGNRGDDVLSGGTDADTFVFSFGGGNETVADFAAGTDTLALQAGLGVSGGAENGGNTLVTFSDGGTVTVIGVNKTDLAAATGWDLG